VIHTLYFEAIGSRERFASDCNNLQIVQGH